MADGLMEQNKLQPTIDEALKNAESIITKSYLSELEMYKIMQPSCEVTDIDIAVCGGFFRLSKLVFDKEESFLKKLTTVVNVVSALGCSLATVIKSSGSKTEYYFGIISKRNRMDNAVDRERRASNITAFKGALSGNLTGSEMDELSKSEIETMCNDIFGSENNCYSAVSGVVSLRDNADKRIEGYVQGIEKLVDSLNGQKYTAIMIADPISSNDVQTIKKGYEILHTQLASFLKSSVIMNESDTLSISKTRSEGIVNGITKGISMTRSTTNSQGKNFGVNASAGISFIVSANVGASFGMSSGVSNTSGKIESESDTRQESVTVADGISSGKSKGKSLQLNFENRSVRGLLEKIDKQIERLDECESVGAFECATYIVADSREKAMLTASNYSALMKGSISGVQESHINTWNNYNDTKLIGKYLKAFVHPRFCSENGNDRICVTPASVISGNEIAVQIGLPKKSINGVTVMPMASFGRNVVCTKDKSICIGNLYHMGQLEETKVSLDLDSLASHVFITGSTGSGKSNTIYELLDKAQKHNVNFLVIEPAKGEYKDVFGGCDNVTVYGTNPSKSHVLRINPFKFNKDIHILEHLDRLIEIFNVCWPMYAAMPAVLKKAIEKAYESVGWDLLLSKNSIDDNLFPTFDDVCDQIYNVVNESEYSADSKSDYIGALATRVESLTTGFYRLMFGNSDISDEELFDKNVIADLSRIGSVETKALIMGILVMKLQEHRMCQSNQHNKKLQHITVLEEAHNLLRRTSTEQTTEGANLLGKSVEMLANAIAEMRTYGEGFVISDQAPGLMDMSVIRNTNTKFVLRLPDYSDRELVGKSMGLNENQINELSKLPQGVAAVYQNDWLEAVLCQVEKFDNKKYGEYNYKPIDERKYLKSYFYKLFRISDNEELSKEDVDFIREWINTLNLSKYTISLLEQVLDGQILTEKQRSEVAYNLFKGQQLGFILQNNSSEEKGIENMKKSIDNMFNIHDDNLTMIIHNLNLETILENLKNTELSNRYKRFIEGSKTV